jgi:para-nitrobenzyl esterase
MICDGKNPARERLDRVRKADKFGPRAMQLPVFGDMNFRSDGMTKIVCI